MLFRKVPVAMTLAACLSGLVYAQTAAKPSGDVTPSIRLVKTRYALGESVFFWIGVRGNVPGPIPKRDWNTCRLTITSPDGTRQTGPIGWPVDGPVGASWEAGSGLGQPQAGTYTLVFECGGQATPPTVLTVGEFPLLRQVHSTFVFEQNRHGMTNPDSAVTWTVKNDTSQVIRFPHRDGMNAMVSVLVIRKNVPPAKRSSAGLFYPPEGLLDKDEPHTPDFGFDNFTWEIAEKVPTITLAPGATYQQRLPLRAVLKTIPEGIIERGDYLVTFSTTLQVLVGEKGQPNDAIYPIRLPISSTTTVALP